MSTVTISGNARQSTVERVTYNKVRAIQKFMREHNCGLFMRINGVNFPVDEIKPSAESDPTKEVYVRIYGWGVHWYPISKLMIRKGWNSPVN